METLKTRKDFRHSFTREFGQSHVNEDGTERFMIQYSLYSLNEGQYMTITYESGQERTKKPYCLHAKKECEWFHSFKEAKKQAEEIYNNLS